MAPLMALPGVATATSMSAPRRAAARRAASSRGRVTAQAGQQPQAGAAAVAAGLNKYSARITQPKSQGASQAMLYATGLKEEDMNKPQASPLARGCSACCAASRPCASRFGPLRAAPGAAVSAAAALRGVGAPLRLRWRVQRNPTARVACFFGCGRGR